MTKRKIALTSLLTLLIAIAMISTACVPSQPASDQALQASPTAEIEQSVTEAAPAETVAAPVGSVQDSEGCTVVSASTVPDPTMQAIFPPPGETDWIQGPSDAYITILEYSDFQ